MTSDPQVPLVEPEPIEPGLIEPGLIEPGLIEPGLIERLLRAQHPELASMPLGRRFTGWDNVITRLGDDLAVRMPRIPESVGSMRKELTWLPRLRGGWTFPAPVPVAAGESGEGYPWPWAVVTWVHGTVHAELPWGPSAAGPFAAALRQLHVEAAPDAPQNLEETRSLAARDGDVPGLIDTMRRDVPTTVGRFDAAAAERVWRAALQAEPAAGPAVYLHADLHLLNVISVDGGFGGITDWGDLCAGDPAVDLGRAAALLPDASAFASFLDAYGADDALRARARGLGLVAAMRLAAMGLTTMPVTPAGETVHPATSPSGLHGLRVLGVLG